MIYVCVSMYGWLALQLCHLIIITIVYYRLCLATVWRKSRQQRLLVTAGDINTLWAHWILTSDWPLVIVVTT